MSDAAHWQSIYSTKPSTEVSWYQRDPAKSLEWIRSVALTLESAILDVGAGSSLLIDRLVEIGYTHVVALDLAAQALAEVETRLGERAGCVEFVVGDILEFVATRPFDVWHDRAALHFLRDPKDQARYADVLRDSLKVGGHAIISTFALGGPTRCSGLEIVQHSCASLQALLGDEFRLVKDEIELHRTPGGGEQRFQYCLFERAAAAQ